MILFDPAAGGTGGGGGAAPAASAPASAPAVNGSSAPSTEPSTEVSGVADSNVDLDGPGEFDRNAPRPEVKAPAPKFRADLIEWAKEAGLTDEDLKDYGSEKALLRALNHQAAAPAPAPVQAPVKPPEAAKPPEPKQAVPEVDVEIPDLIEGDVYPEIAQANKATKAVISSLKAELADLKASIQEDRANAQKSKDEPMFDAFDELVTSTPDYEEFLGKGTRNDSIEPAKMQARLAVLNEAHRLMGKTPFTVQKFNTAVKRAMYSLHGEKLLSTAKVAAKNEVLEASKARRTQFIARPGVRSAPGASQDSGHDSALKKIEAIASRTA